MAQRKSPSASSFSSGSGSKSRKSVTFADDTTTPRTSPRAQQRCKHQSPTNSSARFCQDCGGALKHPSRAHSAQPKASPLPHSRHGHPPTHLTLLYHNSASYAPHPYPIPAPPHLAPPFFAMPPGPGVPRPHPLSQAQPLHDLGFGPTPLFGWASVTPRVHSYGQPKFWRHTKPDYRRFCFSVGKADVPYASLPGGPLEGYPAHMAPQLVGRW